MKKIICFIYLFLTIIRYRIGYKSISFWAWLLRKLKKNDMNSIKNKCMVRYLFLDAFDRNDSFDICYICENYMSVLSERKLPAKYYISIFSAAINESNKVVADTVLDIFFNDPNHFPNKFKIHYEEMYDKKWGEFRKTRKRGR